ncbi:MAG: response regulator transcription factor [Candidatus Marinimicrobia bacterium]|nr:response regulator transcription factor [Candidatus Neomarinimicrobiota bacterium]MCF7828103.1 response regulator transcription factor [Candidatus Neomarinimicrobiota bacterium]MCF7879722.1 response regulator transcription factor [Candidatus Neomarinimicrobiota bacterium]
MSKIRVVLADDHTVVRESIRDLLNRTNKFEVVGEAATGSETIQLVQEVEPDVTVVDIGMPELNGIEATKQLLRRDEDIKIIILSMYSNEEYISQVFNSGAQGYILKDSASEELIEAIQTVHTGGNYITSKLSTLIVNEYIKPKKKAYDPLDELTEREREVLQLIGEGHTNQQIAEKLFISVKTVETHRTNLSNKLDIHNKSELIRYAVKRGIVTIQ